MHEPVNKLTDFKHPSFDVTNGNDNLPFVTSKEGYSDSNFCGSLNYNLNLSVSNVLSESTPISNLSSSLVQWSLKYNISQVAIDSLLHILAPLHS